MVVFDAVTGSKKFGGKIPELLVLSKSHGVGEPIKDPPHLELLTQYFVKCVNVSDSVANDPRLAASRAMPT